MSLLDPAGVSSRALGAEFAGKLIGTLVGLRASAVAVGEQIRTGDDLRLTRAMVTGLAGQLTDMARWCREHAATLASMRDLEHENALAQGMIEAIRAAMTDDYTVTVTPAIDYDLACAENAARLLARELSDAPGRLRMQLQVQRNLAASSAQGQIPVSDGEADRKSGLMQAGPGGPQAAPRRVAPSASASRLLAVTSRLLPPSDRDRYAREFASELWDQAAVGETSAGQLRYASRQGIRVMQLRGLILSPRRESASP
jgi:hypothetical protein